jgi:hypothetical protein
VNRILRWVELVPVRRSKVLQRMEAWRREGLAAGVPRAERGGLCLTDESHVLVAGGWAHV